MAAAAARASTARIENVSGLRAVKACTAIQDDTLRNLEKLVKQVLTI